MSTITDNAEPLPFYLTDASFWYPHDVVESAWVEHAPFAFWLVDVLRPRTLIELGTHNGFSYLCFCQAIRHLDLDTSAWAIDTWRGDEHAGFFGDEVLAELRSVHDPRYGSFSRLVQSTFDDAVAHFDPGSIDVLHIDGRHFYEDVKHDFETWLPTMSSRGVVLLHDINVRERDFGVHRLWSEMQAMYPTFGLRHGHGLGVAAVGDEVPAPVDKLVAAASDPALETRILSSYQRLGSTMALGARIQSLETELSSCAAATAKTVDDMESIRDALAEADEQRQADAIRLHEALSDNKLLRAQLAVAGTEIERQVAAVNEQVAEVERRAASQQRAAEEIALLRQRLDDAEHQASELTDRLNDIYTSRAWKVASLRWRSH
jgi:hypothetical protein